MDTAYRISGKAVKAFQEYLVLILLMTRMVSIGYIMKIEASRPV